MEQEQQKKNFIKSDVIGWHFLPEMPKNGQEVLVAIKYDEYPIQAYWNGTCWKASFGVRDNMKDSYVNDERLSTEEWIYAWCELPPMPPIPEPF